MTTHTIFLVGGENDETAVITQAEIDEDCVLRCDYRGKSILASAADFFDALCEIRRELEKEGLLLFCYGASINVYPSGMSRDMGAGLRAYRMREGKHARAEDLVDIFGDGADVVPTSVDTQRKFWEDWVSSPRL